MLDFIRDEIICPAEINSNRVVKFNDKPVQKDGDIVYLMSRELRVEDNWAMIFASELAKKDNKKLKVVIILEDKSYSKKQEPFLKEGLNFLKKNLALNNIEFEVSEKIPENIGALVVDFNPINLCKFNDRVPPHPNPPPQGGCVKTNFQKAMYKYLLIW